MILLITMQISKEHSEIRENVSSRLLARDQDGDKYPHKWIYQIPPQFLPSTIARLDIQYLIMREIDDVVDEDTSLPSYADSITSYLKQKITFAENYHSPEDSVEILMLQSRNEINESLGSQYAESIKLANRNILVNLDFDHNRILDYPDGGHLVQDPSSLNNYILQMELEGVMRALLTVFGDDLSLLDTLQPLVEATRRHFYLLRDLSQDVTEGRLNLDSDEMGNIDPEELVIPSRVFLDSAPLVPDKKSKKRWMEAYSTFYQSLPQIVQSWMEKQVHCGEELLADYSSQGVASNFRLTTRMLLRQFYEKPAERFFVDARKAMEID